MLFSLYYRIINIEENTFGTRLHSKAPGENQGRIQLTFLNVCFAENVLIKEIFT